MDNRGFAADWYGRSMPPPPQPGYEYSRRPERDDRYNKRRRESSSSSSSDSRARWSVEIPPDGGMWAWVVVLAAALLHVCSELVYFVFYDTIVINKYRNLRLAGLGKTPTDFYGEFMVFENVRFTGEIVAAFFSVFIGYRVVAAAGAFCVLGGFLGASFVAPSEEIELVGFLVGFLGGIGVSFWRFAAYVAVMEYFRRHRMAAIILSGMGRVVGIFAGYGILARPLEQLWPDVYYRCQCAMAGVAFVAALFIRPLSLATARRGDGCEVFLRVRDTRVCRGGMLIFLLFVYFIYYFGESLPATELVDWLFKEGFSGEHTLGILFALASGVLLGYLLLIFWPKKKKFYDTMLWLGLLCLLMGLLTLQLPVFTAPYTSYLCTYTIVFAASQVMFESILRYVIPIAFGRQYIRWVEGLLGLAAGGATIANNFIAKELRKKDGGVDNVYYFAGAAFLAAGVLAVVTMQIILCFKFKDRNHEKESVEPVIQEMSRNEELRASRRDPSPAKNYLGYSYRA
ncbi:hypothetical protein MAR_025216 [Mya arenaria]|uniref:Major facilitator superfamily (MFS) profile domain-containing protein n=1 Tax=Mya arenaria TaxID=6604 RepID=A0ABY7DXI1_MYAAR|nr:hypothetical protein MAR_025216 [Mya arenaria]